MKFFSSLKQSVSIHLHLLVVICQKPLLLWGWAYLYHYPSGLSHICQMSLCLGYRSAMIFVKLILTWHDYVLSICGRSSKTAKKGAARKHLSARSWKFIRNADINILSSISTASTSVENLHPLDGDCSAVVNGNPGCWLLLCVAKISAFRASGGFNETCSALLPAFNETFMALCVSVNTLGCSKELGIVEYRW